MFFLLPHIRSQRSPGVIARPLKKAFRNVQTLGPDFSWVLRWLEPDTRACHTCIYIYDVNLSQFWRFSKLAHMSVSQFVSKKSTAADQKKGKTLMTCDDPKVYTVQHTQSLVPQQDLSLWSRRNVLYQFGGSAVDMIHGFICRTCKQNKIWPIMDMVAVAAISPAFSLFATTWQK